MWIIVKDLEEIEKLLNISVFSTTINTQLLNNNKVVIFIQISPLSQIPMY